MVGPRLSTPATAVQVPEGPKLVRSGKLLRSIGLPRIGEPARITKLAGTGELVRPNRLAHGGRLARLDEPGCSSWSALGGTHLELGRRDDGLQPGWLRPGAAHGSATKPCAQ